MTFAPLRVGKKTLGLIDSAAGVYRIFRHHRTHHCRRYDAYGIQADVLERLKELGVRTVEVDEERASGSVWRSEVPLGEWEEHGKLDTLRASDGAQVFYPLRRLVKKPAQRVREGRVGA